MQDDLIAASRVKLEIFSINEKGEEVSKLSLEQRPASGGGDGGVDYRTTIQDDGNARGLIREMAGWLVTISGYLPPGSLAASPPAGAEKANELVLAQTPVSEDPEYVKNHLPYGEHMAMVNTEIERNPDRSVKRIGGQVRIFRKARSDSPPGETEYLIKLGEGWKKIKDIDGYMKKHRLVIYKVLPERDKKTAG